MIETTLWGIKLPDEIEWMDLDFYGGRMASQKVNYDAGKKGLDKMFIKPSEKLRKEKKGGKNG